MIEQFQHIEPTGRCEFEYILIMMSFSYQILKLPHNEN